MTLGTKGKRELQAGWWEGANPGVGEGFRPGGLRAGLWHQECQMKGLRGAGEQDTALSTCRGLQGVPCSGKREPKYTFTYQLEELVRVQMSRAWSGKSYPREPKTQACASGSSICGMKS